ncbi:class I SAM-dependent methyltransferase [Thiomicrorhabdus sp.]|uniref:class I SAM-dependent methyltransferase n=1 Tax=Thiomicrorhabdus sp. TaxID=2039724 RepID=UPI002AA69C43|nr:methyltransferase domain-containing protein [Thiomicrorhabdus sp.]
MPEIRIRYQTIEFDDIDIHLRCLKDKQQFSDPLGEAEAIGISSAQWSLFGVIWESSEILAQKMEHFEIQGKRILELGCGIGLSSLLLNARNADITATDYHPEAGKFLAKNTTLNNGDDIPFLRTDWKDENLGLGKFDLIIGSDLLYERNHIDLLSGFIERHSEQECEVILVDPGRGKHAQFSKNMVKLGFEHSQYKPNETDPKNADFKGVVLKYKRL